MKLKYIIDFIDGKIPRELALDFDNVGFKTDCDLNLDITEIKIFMDILPEDDKFNENTLIITHHPPLFNPKTPTYTIHSNWDIIDGGANEALAKVLNLEVIDYFDDETKIGRICSSNYTFNQLREIILKSFENPRAVNKLDSNKQMDKIGIISGFGLKNKDYIKLAKDKNIDILISGDLCHETAILAKNLGVTLIDLGHHESEVAGLYELANILEELNVKVEVIDKKPIEKLWTISDKMSEDKIKKMEDLQVPKGRIDLIGCGRLGLRIGINLMQVHRGGPKVIGAFDGQKIDGGDVIFTLLGAETGQNKPDFLKQLCTHDEEFRKIESYPEYINDDNLDLITGDVVIIVIAGGNTIPTAAKIIKHAHERGAKTIGTAGIFGFGDENIEIKDISEYDNDNPAVEELRTQGITENHLVLTTNKLIRDHEPVTPYTLDEVAKIITMNALKLLRDCND